MKVRETPILDLFVIEPILFEDKRGFFYESFNKKKFNKHFKNITFVQDNFSKSKKGVLRGLHYQRNRPQGKLVMVTFGRVFDVAVDLRYSSKTFGKWYGIELSDENKKQFWIPKGFAHGFQVLTDEVHFQYKCTDFYDPSDDHSLLWSDNTLNINWREIDKIVSEKDKNGSLLKDTQPIKI
jgi:dTDP-4-dehydrorhamnose 3,5-epimerase